MRDPILRGRLYRLQNGQTVRIEFQDTPETPADHRYHPAYASCRGSDGIWRYIQPRRDAGRVTGSNFDMSDPRNIVCHAEDE
jgi:hypothetical protein